MKSKLKSKLLSTGRFYDNEFMSKYLDVVVDCRECSSQGETQDHHIIPQYVFVADGLQIDNSDENIVTLSYKNHMIAHYYLARCCKNPDDIGKNALSIRYLLKGKTLESINIEDVDWDYITYMYRCGRAYTLRKSHTVEANKKVSNTLMGRVSPNKGNIKEKSSKSRKNPNAKNKLLSDIASNRIGDKNPFYGRNHSDYTKCLISEKNSKPVAMRDLSTLEVIRTFKSLREASNYLLDNGYAQSSAVVTRLSSVCKDTVENRCAYGFNWRFIDKV